MINTRAPDGANKLFNWAFFFVMWWSVGDQRIYYLAKAALNQNTPNVVYYCAATFTILEETGHWQLNTRPGHINSPKYCYNVITRNSDPPK